MSQSDVFDHSSPAQENMNIAVFRAVRRAGELRLPRQNNLYHTDLGYEISDNLFGKDERRLRRHEQKRVSMIIEAVRQLIGNGAFKFDRRQDGIFLTLGYNAPEGMPQLKTYRVQRSATPKDSGDRPPVKERFNGRQQLAAAGAH